MKGTLNKNAIAVFITVLFIAQIYFGGIVLPGLYENYPELNPNIIMLFYTLPLLVNGLFGLALGAVIARANKKMLVVLGQISIFAGGLIVVMIGSRSFWMALAGAILCGIGAALTQNAGSVLLSMANPEKTSVLVAMNGAVMSFGSMICTALGGVLAETHWTRMYYMAFPALVTLILFLLLYRTDKTVSGFQEGDAAQRADGNETAQVRHTGIFILTVVIFFFTMMNQAAFLPNFSIYVITEKAIGSTAQAGMISTIGAFGGMLGGLFLVALLLPRLKTWAVPFGLLLLLLPNLSIVLGTGSWLVIAVLNFVSMVGLQLVFGDLVGAGTKAFGPAAITTITAMMGLINFVGPYIINVIAGSESSVPKKALIGLICALIGIVIAIPSMKKAAGLGADQVDLPENTVMTAE